MKFVELNFQLRIGQWSVQIGNEYSRAMITVWQHKDSSSQSRWCWDFRSWPRTFAYQPGFGIELIGARFVPVEMVAVEDEHVLDADEVG